MIIAVFLGVPLYSGMHSVAAHYLRFSLISLLKMEFLSIGWITSLLIAFQDFLVSGFSVQVSANSFLTTDT